MVFRPNVDLVSTIKAQFSAVNGMGQEQDAPQNNKSFLADLEPNKTFHVDAVQVQRFDSSKAMDTASIPDPQAQSQKVEGVANDIESAWCQHYTDLQNYVNYAAMNSSDMAKAGVSPAAMMRAVFPGDGPTKKDAAGSIGSDLAGAKYLNVAAAVGEVYQAMKEPPADLVAKIVEEALSAMDMSAEERKAQTDMGNDVPPPPAGDWSKFDAQRALDFAAASLDDQPEMCAVHEARHNISIMEDDYAHFVGHYHENVGADKIEAALESGNTEVLESFAADGNAQNVIEEYTGNAEVKAERCAAEVLFTSETLRDLAGVAPRDRAGTEIGIQKQVAAIEEIREKHVRSDRPDTSHNNETELLTMATRAGANV